MIYGKKICLAKMVVERLRAAMGRKSIPICYGLHLMEMMEKAGVDISCTQEEETIVSSAIDHHTLKRLGYRLQVTHWEYMRQVPGAAQSGNDEETEAEEEEETTAPAASAAASQPPPSRSTSVHLASHVSTEVAHLRQFMVEQLHLLQATVLSKLETIDTRLQICESHILHTSRTSPIPPPSTDPKGKAPMVSPRSSPIPSPITSHAPTPHISSPHPSPSAHTSPSPDPVPSHSSSSTSPTDLQQFEITARSPIPTQVPSLVTRSQDSEATPSDPNRFLNTPPPSPPPPPPAPAPTSSSRTKLPSIKNPTPRSAPTPYTRRKLAVSRPSTSPPPPPSTSPPPPPPSPAPQS